MFPRTLYSLLEDTAGRHGQRVALFQPTGSKSGPKYREYTWNEYRDTVREIACGLRSLGIRKGDIDVFEFETRAEFYVADMGVIANAVHRGGTLYEPSSGRARRIGEEFRREGRYSSRMRRP